DLKSKQQQRSSSNGCFPFIDPSVKSLAELDSTRLKQGIRRWARAVVKYTSRQVSRRFGSSRKSG
ncbi:hypothetical protein M569_11474, partial [Genlisea aurea]